MIDFQSVFCVGRANSPEGCGRLAGDNIPGCQPNNPCALKGRWRQPADSACPYSFLSVLYLFYLNLQYLCLPRSPWGQNSHKRLFALVSEIHVHQPVQPKPQMSEANAIVNVVLTWRRWMVKNSFLPNEPISGNSEAPANQSPMQKPRVILTQKPTHFSLGLWRFTKSNLQSLSKTFKGLGKLFLFLVPKTGWTDSETLTPYLSTQITPESEKANQKMNERLFILAHWNLKLLWLVRRSGPAARRGGSLEVGTWMFPPALTNLTGPKQAGWTGRLNKKCTIMSLSSDLVTRPVPCST